MNRLQGYARDLREMFEGALTVRHIASSLASFDAERTAHKIGSWMARKDFDRIGVRRDGLVVGYADRRALAMGRLGDHCREFAGDDVVSGDLPLLEVLELLQARRALFVRMLGEVHGIVTVGDVTRPAVRLWLFGLSTVEEMQLTRLIRRRYPDDGWTAVLPPKRVKQAYFVLAQKKEHGLDADLVDCLVLSDKHEIVAATAGLRRRLELGDEVVARQTLGRVATLRNVLAHAHDIGEHWPNFLADARVIERVIEYAEQISSADLRE